MAGAEGLVSMLLRGGLHTDHPVVGDLVIDFLVTCDDCTCPHLPAPRDDSEDDYGDDRNSPSSAGDTRQGVPL